MTAPFYIFGSGGHAKVAIAACRDLGIAVTAIFDDSEIKAGTNLWDIPILPTAQARENLTAAAARGFIAVGNNAARKKIAERYEALIEWVTLVHPSAFVDPTAKLGEGTIVCPKAVVNPDARVGRHAILNTASIVEHDCLLGDFMHIAPNSTLAGDVRVADGTFIGAGATVIPSTKIGAWSTVGAGSVVIRDVPDKVTYAGIPARALTDRKQ